MKNGITRHHYGGQALMEGVMILGRTSVVTAVRRPSGNIVTRVQPLTSILNQRLHRLVFFRGVVILLESMLLGIRGMLQSADMSVGEDTTVSSQPVSNMFVFAMLSSAVAFLVLFVFLAPLFLTTLLDDWLIGSLAFHLVEFLIRLALFIGYLKIVSMSREIKRIFAYHGAEHKTVNAWEAGESLEIERVRIFGTSHTRCGTSFIFLVFIVAFIVFTLIGLHALWLMVIIRLVLVPVVISLAYELLFVIARLGDSWLARAVRWPGNAIQSMTTSEPDDLQIEVAIAAMRQAIDNDNDKRVTGEVPSHPDTEETMQ